MCELSPRILRTSTDKTNQPCSIHWHTASKWTLWRSIRIFMYARVYTMHISTFMWRFSWKPNTPIWHVFSGNHFYLGARGQTCSSISNITETESTYYTHRKPSLLCHVVWLFEFYRNNLFFVCYSIQLSNFKTNPANKNTHTHNQASFSSIKKNTAKRLKIG